MDPYQAPTSRDTGPGQGAPGDLAFVTRKITLAGSSAEVLLGKTRLRIWFAHWSGLETYHVDGQEVLRLRSFALSGTRMLLLPDGRTVVLDVRYLPLVTTSLVIDGQRVVADVFPHLRWWGQIIPLIVVAAGVAFVLAVFRFGSWLR